MENKKLKKCSALMLSTIFVRKFPDSTANFTLDYAEGLAQIFKKVYVLVPHSNDNKEPKYHQYKNLNVERFTYFFRNSWQYLCYRYGIPQNLKQYPLAWIQIPFFLIVYLLKTIKYRNKIDVIYCHWTPTIIPALILKFFYKKKIVVILHGSDINHLPKIFNKIILKCTDIITTGHSDIMETLKKKLKIKKRINLIRNFTNQKIPKLKNIKQKNQILFFSRLADIKNPLFFMKLAKEFFKQNQEINFVMAGDGELKTEILQFAKTNKLKNFKYIGARDDIKEIILESKAVLFCSKYQSAFTTTLLESILMHKPIILNDIGDNLKYFKHNINCIAYEYDDLKDCCNKIIELINYKYDLEKITSNAYDTLKKAEFLNKEIIHNHYGYLEHLISNLALKNLPIRGK